MSLRFKFSIDAGILCRSGIRQELAKLKSDFEYHFPPGKIKIDETKGFLSSLFIIKGEEFPDNFQSTIVNLKQKLESFQ